MTIHTAPRILIVKLSAIGDVVHTLPALNALRKHFPEAHISWVVEEAASDLVVGHQALDAVFISRRKTWLKGLRGPGRHRNLMELMDFIKQLRSRSYDMVFDFQASLKGAVLIAMTRSRRKIGFDKGMAHQEGSYHVLNERIPAVSMEIHALTRGLKLLEAVGIPSRMIDYHLPITQDDYARADNLLAEKGIRSRDKFLVINPMAKWPTKLWQASGFAALADHIRDRFGMPMVFTGSRDDGPGVGCILQQMKAPAINLAGRTSLMTLGAILSRAAVMVTTDTGPMHMAAAVNTPVVALFGPTAPWRTGPFGKRHRVVRANTDCAPCFKRTCADVKCMNEIDIHEILHELEGLLN